MSVPDPNPLERLSAQIGKNPAEVAALDRAFAGLRECAVARFNLEVSAKDTAGAFRNLAEALRESDRRLAITEASEIAAHPGLMEFDAQMNGFYS